MQIFNFYIKIYPDNFLKYNILNELKLTLESVNPAHFWGTNNENYELIKSAFPKLKLVARGNEVKVLGMNRNLRLSKKNLTS